MKNIYQNHIKALSQTFEQAMAKTGFDYVVIAAGSLQPVLFDDSYYPFKVNPYFNWWLPLTKVPNCLLVVKLGAKNELHYHQPTDFWHKVFELGSPFWADAFEVKVFKRDVTENLNLPEGVGAFIGADDLSDKLAQQTGVTLSCNPANLLTILNWHRAYKSDYELEMLRLANKKAIKGHEAARAAFDAGLSEAAINQHYLAAVEETSDTMPYTNIVALNSNTAILHYMEYEKEAPQESLTFLIDAGASYNGYASDITRTYVKDSGVFSDLVNALDSAQLELISAIKPGLNYADLHHQAHERITQLLIDVEVIKTSYETAMEAGLSQTFFPHGLGHFLGLQVHDLGGHQASEKGGVVEPPKSYPFLRCTRTMEARQVFTIEPGIYFIPSLLADLREGEQTSLINWKLVDALLPYGGIRIEDNVAVHDDSVENITRAAWQK